jgi:hypothetical protein
LPEGCGVIDPTAFLYSVSSSLNSAKGFTSEPRGMRAPRDKAMHALGLVDFHCGL